MDTSWYFEYINNTSKIFLNIIAQITFYLICDAGDVCSVIYVLSVLLAVFEKFLIVF